MKTIATTQTDKERIRATLDPLDQPERILDVGCVRHNRAQRAWGNLHASIHATWPDSTIVGIDVDEKEVERMSAPGYTIKEANCETMHLGDTFDAIIAGEVLEHLANPGRFLDRAESHLHHNGKVVLTTPNPDCLKWALKAKTGHWTSEAHTCWVGPKQLGTLLDRSTNGLSIQDITYFNPTRLDGWAKPRLACKSYRAVIA